MSSSNDGLATALREEDDVDFYHDVRQDVGVFNYYFLLLGVLAVLIAVAVWLIHRRKVRQRVLWRQDGQQVLARDVEAWPGTRRLIHGRCRATNSVFLHRTEGLDEHGEAPPPYQPKTQPTSLDIPLRALPMDESDRSLPPQYCDREHTASTPSTRQGAAQP